MEQIKSISILKNFLFTSLFIFLSSYSYSQSKVSILGGWTVAKVRSFSEKNISQGPHFGDLTKFPLLHSGYIGIEYEYDYKKLHLSTGLSFMTFGSSADPFFGHPWPNFYWVIPLLGGYKTTISKDLSIVLETGLDLGFQQGQDFINEDNYRFNVNIVFGLEVHWKRFCLGTRLHWGVNSFRVFEPVSYKHTALTTYLGYILWDHAKSKARRLRKQQEKNLD